jgi:hypothetical protein
MHGLRPEIPIQLDDGHVSSYLATAAIHRGAKETRDQEYASVRRSRRESQKGNAPVCSR